eukprot:SAG31_NODE_4845_length_2908_cov_5.326095_3_plen_54_part_00
MVIVDALVTGSAVKDHAWDVNGLGHRALVAKINANLQRAPRNGPADSGACCRC